MFGVNFLLGTVLAAGNAAADEGGGLGGFIVLCIAAWVLWLIFRPKKRRYAVDHTTTVRPL